MFTQRTRDVEPELFWCWGNVEDNGPKLEQRWFGALFLLGGLSALLTQSAELAILPTCYSTDLCLNAAPTSRTLAQQLKTISRFNTLTFLYKAVGVLGTFTRLNMSIYFINYFCVLGAAGSSS